MAHRIRPPALEAVRRLRLLAVFAGLAWLLGITPATPVRLLLALAVAVALTVDALADRDRAAVRITTLGRPGGGER